MGPVIGRRVRGLRRRGHGRAIPHRVAPLHRSAGEPQRHGFALVAEAGNEWRGVIRFCGCVSDRVPPGGNRDALASLPSQPPTDRLGRPRSSPHERSRSQSADGSRRISCMPVSARSTDSRHRRHRQLSRSPSCRFACRSRGSCTSPYIPMPELQGALGPTSRAG
jgi:hypothetical protein